MADKLREAIRSILREELSAQGMASSPGPAPGIRVEEIEVDSDRDLERFVRRLLKLAGDGTAISDIENGRHRFTLRKRAPTGPLPNTPEGPGRARGTGSMTIDRGLVTERQVRNFPDDVSMVRLGSSARLTPLASDAMRRAGIKIEKVKS